MEDIAKPVKMIIFNGPLSFSPNTLNNNIITYALAKRWEQQQRTYADWYQLIQNVTQIAKSLSSISSTLSANFQELASNMRFFNTWNVEGDGSAFVDFQAKALFDSQANPPFRILNESERFPVSSPPGYHKAVISDMDTDSQFKSKLFALQLIIKQNLSLALQPTSFVNIGPKYYRQYSDQTMGADWWAKGKLKVLSDKQVTYPNSVLNFFAQTARGQQVNGLSPTNNFQLRMNQFNYSQASKLSFISGYILQSEVENHLSISYCRRIKLMDQVQGFGYVYLHQVVRQQSRGILIDLNSISYVYRNKQTTKFQFQKMSVWIQSCFQSDSEGVAPVVQFTLTNEQLFASCGFYYYDNVTLIDSKGSIKAEFTFPEEIYQDLKNDAIKAGRQLSYTNPFVLGWSEEQEYSFQIEERFRKTQYLYKDDPNMQNVQAFYPYIDYKFKCSRFGKPIPAKDTLNMQIQLQIDLVLGDGSATPGIDATGIMQYSDPSLKDMFDQALLNPQFKSKYISYEEIQNKWYLKALPDMVELAGLLKSKTSKDLKFNWYNSQGVKFTGQFYESEQVLKNKIEQIRKITVDIDQNGQGTFRVFLNENITRKNNPRSLCNQTRGNSIINSLCIESTIQPTIITFKGQQQIRTPTSLDSISGLYYESNPQFGARAADWKNFVGPRMRVMGLLYPAMQKIIDLYNFKEIDLGSMKRAFDIQSQLHSRYMPSTREISSYEHRMMRRWLYEPYYDHFNASNLNYNDIYRRVYPHETNIKSDFFTKKKVLRQLLKNSFAFELLTIPLYLTAMYGAPSSTIQKLIRGISHDQMKHLFIASNLLNAIREQGCEAEENGPPYLDDNYVPNFPQSPIYAYQSNDPYIKELYTFDILPFGQELLLKFIAAQFPGQTESLILSTETDESEAELPPQVKEKINKVTEMIQKVNQEKASNPNFATVGEMYSQVTQLLWQLSDEEDLKNGKVLFSGNPIYQFTYPQLENMTEIYSLRTALNQIRLIVEEGQGSRLFSVESKLKKLSHFLKFIQVYVGCQVDEGKTNSRNDPYQSGYFKIYFKYDPNWIVIDSEKNSWKSEEGQNQYIRGIIAKQQDGKTPGPYCQYTNNISAAAFTNMYKKIMLQFHYIFNSRYSRFKLYLKNDKQLDLPEAECLAKFKTFKFRRMENAIGKMRNMSLLARYNIRLKDTPVFQIGNPSNQGKSVKPDFNIHVQFPED